MLFLKYVFLVSGCFILTTSASAIDFGDLFESQKVFVDKDYELILNHRDRLPYDTNWDYTGELKPILSREVRSPHGQFPSGRISNTNGRGSSDAYAHATHNTDFTRKRQSRSPHGQFPSGRISNTNGRGTSDAYAHATRNTDFTRKRF